VSRALKDENIACSYKAYQTAAALAACEPEAGRTTKKRYALSFHRVSEAGAFRSPISAQLAHSRSEQYAVELRPAKRPKTPLETPQKTRAKTIKVKKKVKNKLKHAKTRKKI
jgi:hypothetical protein